MTADFALEVAGVLAEGRALAESLMTCTIQWRSETGETTTDPATDGDVAVWADEFESPCKIQDTEPIPVESEVGARTVITVRQRIDMPVASPLVVPGWVGEITAAPSPMDAHLLGMKFEAVASQVASYKTAHRWPVRRYLS